MLDRMMTLMNHVALILTMLKCLLTGHPSHRLSRLGRQRACVLFHLRGLLRC